jgi:hypothetical protein
MKKSIAFVAMCATALSPILSTPSFAAVTILDDTPAAAGPSAANLLAMEGQCDALAAAHGVKWTGELDESSIAATYVSGPTEIGTHTYALNGVGDQVGAGTFTPAHIEIEGDPYRNGGSVNMFGDAVAVGGYYSASAYDFEADFSTTYSYSFNCTMSESVYIPAEGYYVIEPTDQGNEEAGQQSCDAFTALGSTWEHWGSDHAQCDFVKTGGDVNEDQERPDEAGTPIIQAQTDSLLAHEDFGEGFSTSETLAIGKVVVCISPSKTGTKLPGAWQTHNGYTGNLCTTEWYNGGAKTNVSNLNDGSHNWVTVPLA